MRKESGDGCCRVRPAMAHEFRAVTLWFVGVQFSDGAFTTPLTTGRTTQAAFDRQGCLFDGLGAAGGLGGV